MLIKKILTEFRCIEYGLSRLSVVLRILGISKHPVGPHQLRYLRRMHLINKLSELDQLLQYTHLSVFPISRFYKHVYKFKKDIVFNILTHTVLISINIGAMIVSDYKALHLACILLLILVLIETVYFRLKHLHLVFRNTFNSIESLSDLMILNRHTFRFRDVMFIIDEIRRTIGNTYPPIGKPININRPGYTDGIVVNIDRSRGSVTIQIKDPVHPGSGGQVLRIEIDYLETLESQGAHGLM